MKLQHRISVALFGAANAAQIGFGPGGCVSVSRNFETGSCTLRTDCEGKDISKTEFVFFCQASASEGSGIVRHSFGVGGFDVDEDFDTEVKCAACTTTWPGASPSHGAAPPAHDLPTPVKAVRQAARQAAPEAAPEAAPGAAVKEEQDHEEAEVQGMLDNIQNQQRRELGLPPLPRSQIRHQSHANQHSKPAAAHVTQLKPLAAEPVPVKPVQFRLRRKTTPVFVDPEHVTQAPVADAVEDIEEVPEDQQAQLTPLHELEDDVVDEMAGPAVVTAAAPAAAPAAALTAVPGEVFYGPRGCVGTYKSVESHCIMRTMCNPADITNFDFGVVCVDKEGFPVKHSFGTNSFDPQETFDTLIVCDRCLGLTDLPADVAVAGQVVSLTGEVGDLKGMMMNLSSELAELNNAVYPTVPSPPPGLTPKNDTAEESPSHRKTDTDDDQADVDDQAERSLAQHRRHLHRQHHHHHHRHHRLNYVEPPPPQDEAVDSMSTSEQDAAQDEATAPPQDDDSNGDTDEQN